MDVALVVENEFVYRSVLVVPRSDGRRFGLRIWMNVKRGFACTTVRQARCAASSSARRVSCCVSNRRALLAARYSEQKYVGQYALAGIAGAFRISVAGLCFAMAGDALAVGSASFGRMVAYVPLTP